MGRPQRIDAAVRERFDRFLKTGKLEPPPDVTPEMIADAQRHRAESDSAWSRLQARQKVDHAIGLSEIGALFAERTFENFGRDMLNGEALDKALWVAEDPSSRSMGLYGPVGDGKTHLAGAVWHRALAKYTPAVMIPTVTLISRLQATNKPSSREDEEALIRHYAATPVLILDDLGKERLTEWGAKAFFALINARYEAKKPLIVTANADWAELLEKKYSRLHEQRDCATLDPNTGVAIMDRIYEMTGAWVQNRAPSYRVRAADERRKERTT